MAKMWLDDVRNPATYGYVGFDWVKTYDEAITYLSTHDVEECSLDHDLSEGGTIGLLTESEKTGYDVVRRMEENSKWPEIINVHSLNPSGSGRMVAAINAARSRGIDIRLTKISALQLKNGY